MNCEICFEKYNTEANKPYSLYSCGHTYCKSCLDKLIKKECPTCKREIRDQQVNYALMAILHDEPLQTTNDKNKTTLKENIQNKLTETDISQRLFREQIENFEKINSERIKQMYSKIQLETHESIQKLKEQKEIFIKNISFTNTNFTNTMGEIKKSEKLIDSKFNIIKLNLNNPLVDLEKLNQELELIDFNSEINKIKILCSDYENELNEIDFGRLSLNLSKDSKIEELHLLNDLSTKYFNEGEELFYDSKLKKSIGLMIKAIAVKNDNAKAYFLKGRLFFRLEKYEKAIECFNNAILIAQNYFPAYKGLYYCYKGFVLQSLSKNEEANRLFAKSLELNQNPENAFDFYTKALTLSGLKKYNESLEFSTEAIRLDPNNVEFYILKAHDLFLIENGIESILNLNKAIQLKPNYDLAYNNKGNSLKSLDQFEESIFYYNQALNKCPECFIAYKNKIEIFEILGRYTDIVDTVDKWLEIKPDYSFVYDFKIASLVALGRIDEAINYCFVILENEKSLTSIYKSCLEKLVKHEKYERAIYYSDKAIFMDSKDDDLYAIKIVSLNKMKKYAEALELSNKAVEMSLNNEVFHMYKGEALIGLKKKKDAIKSFQKALELKPNDLDIISKIKNAK